MSEDIELIRKVANAIEDSYWGKENYRDMDAAAIKAIQATGVMEMQEALESIRDWRSAPQMNLLTPQDVDNAHSRWSRHAAEKALQVD